MRGRVPAFITTTIAAAAAWSFGLAQAATVPYEQGFDISDGVPAPGVDLNGLDGEWISSDVESGGGVSGRALSSSDAQSGEHAAAVTNADFGITFSDDRGASYTEFHTKPFFGPAADIPADASAVFYVNATGTVVAYNGTTATLLGDTAVTSNTYVKFLVAADYVNQLFDLYLDDTKIATDFAFYSSSNTDFNAFVVRADSSTNATYLDAMSIIVSDPNFVVTNAQPQTPGNDDVTLVVDNATPGGTYLLIAADNDPDAPQSIIWSNTLAGSPPFLIPDIGVLADPDVTTRYYQLVDTASGTTNPTVWVMQRRDRISQRWYVLGLPVQFDDEAQNDLSGEAGRQLARGLFTTTTVLATA